MIRIEEIIIQNYRSIIKIEINIDTKGNIITFCGANNVGKTNILNAIALYFDKLEYSPKKDCPHHKYYGTQGGSYQPKITIIFFDNETKYIITKDWNLTKEEKREQKNDYKMTGTKNTTQINENEINDFLKKINIFYLESINISFPNVIKYIMNRDIIDLETDKSRFSGKKKNMKENIENVLKDLQEILNTFGDSISPLLERYKNGWGIAFDLPNEVNTFRDLMIAEIDFYIRDKSNSKEIDAKGSGLQRLSHILMHFRIIEKLNEKNESVILLIDEPDVYLHSGLQKKLLEDFLKYSMTNQILITTHSPIFIDTNKLLNVNLIDQKIEEDKEFKRGQRKNSTKTFNVISTVKVDMNETNGITKLKEYLGIDNTDSLLFDKYNILVEGDEDRKYLIKLMKSFNLNVPNIISCTGADNIPKYLDFYNSLSDDDSKNKFLVILDNDTKGRDVFTKIKSEQYTNISVKKRFIISYSGYEYNEHDAKTNTNIEIEDFIKPEIICKLTNVILKKRSFKIFDNNSIKSITDNINKKAFQTKGILSAMDNRKNELNPDNGHNVDFNSPGFKGGIANLFDKLDKDIILMIGNIDDKENKHIYKFLKDIQH